MAESKNQNAKNVEKKKRGKKPGSEKTGGRKKGTPNKERQSLLQFASELGDTPAEYLIKIYTGKLDTKKYTYSEAEKMDAANKVAPYLHPKLRSTEIKGDIIPATLIIKSS